MANRTDQEILTDVRRAKKELADTNKEIEFKREEIRALMIRQTSLLSTIETNYTELDDTCKP